MLQWYPTSYKQCETPVTCNQCQEKRPTALHKMQTSKTVQATSLGQSTAAALQQPASPLHTAAPQLLNNETPQPKSTDHTTSSRWESGNG